MNFICFVINDKFYPVSDIIFSTIDTSSSSADISSLYPISVNNFKLFFSLIHIPFRMNVFCFSINDKFYPFWRNHFPYDWYLDWLFFFVWYLCLPYRCSLLWLISLSLWPSSLSLLMIKHSLFIDITFPTTDVYMSLVDVFVIINVKESVNVSLSVAVLYFIRTRSVLLPLICCLSFLSLLTLH